MKVFGELKANIDYIWRPAVYGLMFNDPKDKIGIILTTDGKYFLPGGGIENGESHEECLKREAIEEMGMEVEIGPFIGCAQRYFYSTNQYKYYLSEGHFYLCQAGNQLAEPLEKDHFLYWLKPGQAVERLFHEHQSWAVKEAIKKIKNHN